MASEPSCFCYGVDHPEVSSAHNDLATLLWQMGDYDNAAGHYEAAAEILRKNDPGGNLPILMNTYGTLLANAELPDEARSVLEEALRLTVDTYGGEHHHTAQVQRNLGRLLLDVDPGLPP